MTRIYRLLSNNIVRVSLISILTIFTFLAILFFLNKLYFSNNNKNLFKYSEFGDYIGGILNPLFTLLSTVAIIYLTYSISNNESKKADKAIETQKRITLNQMRQAALNDLIEKTNLYIYEIGRLSLHDAKEGMLIQKVLTRMIEEEEKNKEKEKVIVWLIILNELENFIHLKYLFLDLFEKDEFKEKYKSIISITSKLCEEQTSLKFITNKTLEDYITTQKELITIIGNYIYTEF